MNTLTPPLDDRASDAPFLVESGAVMQQLRTSVSEVLRAVPQRVRTTRDLQTALGVDVKLCWQVLKLGGPGDALSLARFVPTAVPMRRFLRAARTAGVDRAVVDRVGAAYEAFTNQVAIHAGDRPTFEAMATAGPGGDGDRAGDDLPKAAARLRKAAFQTASRYAGVQLDTYLGLSFVHPGARHGRLDAAFLRCKLGVRRLRPAVDLHVDSTRLVASDAADPATRDAFGRETLDPEAADRYGAPILPRFSSDPLPRFLTTTDANGTSHTRVAGDGVGQRATADLVFGQRVSDVPLTALYGGTRHGFATSIDMTTPTGVVILDKLVHRPTFPRLDLGFTVDWMFAPPPVDGAAPPPHLPFHERLVRLDAGVDGARMRDVPGYVDIVEYVCGRCGWRADEFDVYRVRVDYPLMFTRLWTKFVPA